LPVGRVGRRFPNRRLVPIAGFWRFVVRRRAGWRGYPMAAILAQPSVLSERKVAQSNHGEGYVLSRKLFGQIVLLIVIANLTYFAMVQVLNWQALRAYEQRMKVARDEAKQSAELARKASALADEAETSTLSATPADPNENMIDGQVVHRVGDNWVNDQGTIIKAGE